MRTSTQLFGGIILIIAMVNAFGQPAWTLDKSFSPSATKSHFDSATIESVAVQPDGKLLVNGEFWLVNGSPVPGGTLARLNVDGSLDLGFEAASGVERGARMSLQPDGKILLITGTYASWPFQNRFFTEPEATGTLMRLNANGSRDTTFQSVVKVTLRNAPVFASHVQRDGKIVVFGKLSSNDEPGIVRLNADGTFDSMVEPKVDGVILCVGFQNDGKIIIGGEFKAINGIARRNIARLNGDGGLDLSFEAGWPGRVRQIQALQDGATVIVGGYSSSTGEQFWGGRLHEDGTLKHKFLTDPAWCGNGIHFYHAHKSGKLTVHLYSDLRGGEACNQIVRLNDDGTIDGGFEPIPGYYHDRICVAEDDAVYYARGEKIARFTSKGIPDPNFSAEFALPGYYAVGAFEPGGKLLVAGHFEFINAPAHRHIARLNPDGRPDATFRPRLEAGAELSNLARQNDGKILIAGSFDSVSGVPRHGLARLNADGTLDSSYDADLNSGAIVRSLALQSDGKALIIGSFTSIAGEFSSHIARLNSDGSWDVQFGADLRSGQLVLVQRDGKVIVSGAIDQTGEPRGLVRLMPDGSVDSTFNTVLTAPGYPNDRVPQPGAQVAAEQRDGRLLVGGIFSIVNGAPRTGLARLNPDGSLDASFNPLLRWYELPFVSRIVVAPDDRIYIAGGFDTVNGASRSGIARLRSDGSLDDSFDIKWVHGAPSLILIKDNGDVLLGGGFTHIYGQEQQGLALFRRAPILRVGKLPPSGDLQLSIGGEANWTYRIETSTDLVNWTLLREAPSTGAITQFSDVGIKSNGFYRVQGR